MKTFRSIKMKMFVKLLALSVLFSSCLTITLPKSTLIKLCQTARSVRDLGLNNDELISAMKSIMQNNIRKLESPSHLKQDCKLELSMTNSGLVQAVIMPRYLEELNDELLKSLRSSIFNYEPASDSSSIPITASQVVSSLTFDYCNNIDFPESIDTENQIEVQKVALKIISSVLKQHINATQLIEEYLRAVDKHLFTE